MDEWLPVCDGDRDDVPELLGVKVNSIELD